MVAWRASVAALIPLLGCGEVAPPGDPQDAPAHRAALTITSPAEDAWVFEDAPELVVEGTAQGLRALRLRVDQGPWHPLEAHPGWGLSLQTTHGVHTVEVTGVAADGQAHRVVRRVGLGWQVVLAPPQAHDEPVVLRWDRDGLAGWWAQGAAAGPRLDLVPLLQAGLRGAAEDPGHPVQALRATAADLAATRAPLAEPLERAAALGLPPARVVADAFGTSLGEVLLPPEALAAPLLAAHPAEAECCAADVGALLGGLAPWLATLGAKGPHPGLLAAVTPVLLEGDFSVAVAGRVQALLADGLDASGHPVRGALGHPEATLDRQDPEAITVQGLAARPRIALTLRVPPGPHFGAPAEAAPGTAQAHPAWSLPPWLLARQIIALAQARAIHDGETRRVDYALGNLEPGLSVGWSGGHVQATLSPALGGGARAAWAWELVLEAVQDRLDVAPAEPEGPLEWALPAVDWPGGAADLEARIREGLTGQMERLLATLAAQRQAPGAPLLLFDGHGLRFDEGAGVEPVDGAVRGSLKALPVRPGAPVRLVATGLEEPMFLQVDGGEAGVRVGVIPGASRW